MLAGQQKGSAPASLRLPGTRPYTRAILFRVRPCGFRASGVGAFRASAPSHSELPRQKAPQWPPTPPTPKRPLWLKHRCLCEAINGSRPPPSPLSFLPFARSLSLSFSLSFSLSLALSGALSLSLSKRLTPQAAHVRADTRIFHVAGRPPPTLGAPRTSTPVLLNVSAGIFPGASPRTPLDRGRKVRK